MCRVADSNDDKAGALSGSAGPGGAGANITSFGYPYPTQRRIHTPFVGVSLDGMAAAAPPPKVTSKGLDVKHDEIDGPLHGSVAWLRQQEADYATTADVLEHHLDLDARMRATLLDWMMEVCQDFLLKRETFSTAANLCDRFMSKV